MIKRTINIQSPVKLNLHLGQLQISYKDDFLPSKTVPIEDLGFLIIENDQVVITQKLIVALAEANVVVVHCDQKHMPLALTQPLYSNTLLTERIPFQVNCSLPLKKQLWQQTVSSKIENQARFLRKKQIPAEKMFSWAKDVKPGDELNHESRAAVFYWKHIYGPNFQRDPDGGGINDALNYSYAILRAVTARALIASGLLLSIGIFHRNKYNPYVLADDIMEPYRPYVDEQLKIWMDQQGKIEGIDIPLKTHLLKIPVIDVLLESKMQPLMLAMSRTTNSLQLCFSGKLKKIRYPKFE